MGFRTDNFFSNVILIIQIFIGLLIVRFVFFWLGYNGYVPVIDDAYMFLAYILQWAASGGADFLLPKGF